MSNLSLATITTQEWPMVMQQAKMLCSTGFLPSAINTPEKAIAIMMKGRELGIPPMYALSNIAIIQGKPAASAELMLALIYRDHGDDAIQFVETTATTATISYKRRSWKERREHSFTTADAKAAGLTGGNWNKYPAAMLRARCISAVARLAFPDTISGMYTPDELGVETNIETGEYRAPQLVDTHSGEIIDAPTNDASYQSPGLKSELDPPAAPQPPKDTREAEQRFYARYAEEIGGQEWSSVQRYLESRSPRPRTIDGWIAAGEAVQYKMLISLVTDRQAQAIAAGLDPELPKPLEEMDVKLLKQHARYLSKLLADHAAQDQTPQRAMPEERLPDGLPDVRQQIAA